MNDNANILHTDSIVNTHSQTELLFAVHQQISEGFFNDPEYNPVNDPWMLDCSKEFNVNISFLGQTEIKIIKLKDGVVSYERFNARRRKN